MLEFVFGPFVTHFLKCVRASLRLYAGFTEMVHRTMSFSLDVNQIAFCPNTSQADPSS